MANKKSSNNKDKVDQNDIIVRNKNGSAASGKNVKTDKNDKADKNEKAGKNEEVEKAELSEAEKEALEKKRKFKYSVISYGLGVVAVLLIVLFIAEAATDDPPWFAYIAMFFQGLFSWAALGIPVLLIYCAYFLPKIIKEKRYKWNLIVACSLLVNASVVVGLVLNASTAVNNGVDVQFSEYIKGVHMNGGGLVGAYVAWLFSKALWYPGAWILSCAIGVLQITLLVDLSLGQVGGFFWKYIKKLGNLIKKGIRKLWAKITKKEYREEKKLQKSEDDGDDETFVAPEAPAEGTKYYHKPIIDNPYADDAGDSDAPNGLPKPEVIARPDAPEGWGSGAQSESAGKIKKEKTVGGSVDLDDIFTYDPNGKKSGGAAPVILEVEDDEDEPADEFTPVAPTGKTQSGTVKAKRTVMMTAATDEEEDAPVKAYTYPPISLLTAIPAKQTDASEELQSNATRLVETLRSFKVRTKVVNISRGPTITRYELQPEEGVRVRAISNLVDDISLNLAASGVRIEAPIPGKSAVGVEVPNKQRETVYLRTLIDDPRFEQMSAKLTAAIGVDVAGDPIYVDLAKMPHLLIAGTTGSGKSVCMNCLILSILYKASPDEVKMIMIDPKKVEFNVYNGLPHLVIPVVSNSKKAAGALSWAVSEMERRYELIEQVGVRDLKSYNRITADDPEKEFMPQLVIIIDELADLMLTAPTEVEESICRIAQKGRACGMHLIIGTQRPSVDVITGLIKANVPSRVAFTVSSQVDSRTIIDIAGAEKLIGRGDMLFAPIGAMKPMRLQGAFVSDEEVEAVTNFIIDHCAEAVYDEKVIKDIEKEAELCGAKGKKPAADIDSSDDDGESDPMLKAAIDLAVESGKISTSLIQRRLSLGYGRAAKLIDEMEKRGIVSPPEGQKPRSVLITAAEWHEICLRSEE